MEKLQAQIFDLLKNKYVILFPDSFLHKLSKEISEICLNQAKEKVN